MIQDLVLFLGKPLGMRARYVVGHTDVSTVGILTPSMLLYCTGHAKEALSLAQMQEQTLQLEQQSKLKVSCGLVPRGCENQFTDDRPMDVSSI